jgi:hypothetical protein
MVNKVVKYNMVLLYHTVWHVKLVDMEEPYLLSPHSFNVESLTNHWPNEEKETSHAREAPTSRHCCCQ